MSKRIIPVILSGGSGTRLWPLSRADRPKQFLALAGEQSLLQQTALRVADPGLFAEPVVVASAGHADQIEAQLQAVGRAPAQLILEPAARNTAPAIALAALSVGPEELLLVLPSDHVVGKPEVFRAAVEAAQPLARSGMLVTFGITPDRPETGYGYIEQGEEVGPGQFRAERFVEKPDFVTAEGYLHSGRFFWNAGIFLMSADAFLDALETHAPDVLVGARSAITAQRAEEGRIWPDARGFGRAPSISVDNAVMEKAARVAVVPIEIGWSDVGSWDALHEIGAKDAAGNALSGDVLAIDTENCLLRSDGATIVTLGVRDLIVVVTDGAVLVGRRGESQRVKEAVDALKRRGECG